MKTNNIYIKSYIFFIISISTISLFKDTKSMWISPQTKKLITTKKKLAINENPQPQLTEEPFNNLILLLDPHKNENVMGQSIAITQDLMHALQEKTAPIIASTNLMLNICFWKTELRELKSIERQTLKTNDISIINQKAKVILEQFQEIGLFKKCDPSFILLISMTTLSDNDWECYLHKQADVIILIPKKYNTLPLTEKSSKMPLIEKCGFNSAPLDKITNVSPASILNHLQAKNTEKPINIVEAIESMIIPRKSSEETDAHSWNIYITGHGGPAKKKKILVDKYNNDLKQIEQILTKIESLEKKENSPEIKELIKESKKIFKDVKLQKLFLDQIKHLPDEAIVPQTACIAGISLDEFSQLMNFFNNSIETKFIYYSTCFGGGYNQTFVRDMLQKLKVNFIVVAEGSSESSIRSPYTPIIFDENGKLTLSKKNFTRFFELLETFFGTSANIMAMKKNENWQKNPIATIASSFIDTEITTSNQPFVYIPIVGVFTALNIDNKIKILTHSIVRSHELEGRTIDTSNSEIETIIVYPSYIGIPLKKTTKQKILSPTPQTTQQLYKSTHIFEEIITDSRLYNVISEFISLNSSYSTITFVIKKLTALNYPGSELKRKFRLFSDKGYEILPIENMIIQVKGNLSKDNVIDTDINIVFMLDNQTYSFSHHLKDLAKNMALLESLFGTLAFSSQLGDLATQILNVKEITKLKERSVPAMVEYFENSIDKQFEVQKIGSLKKVLLMKQLQILEETLNVDSLLTDQKLPQKNNNLLQYKEDLNRLHKDFTQMKTDKILDDQEYVIIENRIKKAETILTKKQQ